MRSLVYSSFDAEAVSQWRHSFSKVNLTICIPYALDPECYFSEYRIGKPKNQYGFK